MCRRILEDNIKMKETWSENKDWIQLYLMVGFLKSIMYLIVAKDRECFDQLIVC